jgi:hypothetical protein
MSEATAIPVPPPSTRRRIPAGTPLLVGRLVFTPGRRRSSPVLTLHVWCPYCRRTHCHGWPDAEARLSAVAHRAAHCDDSSPWRAGGYWIGLDPAALVPNRKAREDYRRALAVTTEFVPVVEVDHAQP